MSIVPEKTVQNSNTTEALTQNETEQEPACTPTHEEECNSQSACSENIERVNCNDRCLPEHSLNQKNSNAWISKEKQQPQNTGLYCAATATQSYLLQEVNENSTASTSLPSNTDLLQENASAISSREFHQEQVRKLYQETSYNIQSQLTSGAFIAIHSSYEKSTNVRESNKKHQPSKTVEPIWNKTCCSQNDALDFSNTYLTPSPDLSQTSDKLFTGIQQAQVPKLRNDGRLEPVNHLEVLQNKAELNLAGSYRAASSKYQIENRTCTISFQSEKIYSNQNLLPYKINDQSQDLMCGSRDIDSDVKKIPDVPAKCLPKKPFLFTKEQIKKLKELYDKYEYPTKAEILELAQNLDVEEYRVNNWFKNHRRNLPKQIKQGRDKKLEELYQRTGGNPLEDDIQNFCREEGLSREEVQHLLQGKSQQYHYSKRKLSNHKKDE